MSIHFAWPQYRLPWDLALAIASFDGEGTPEVDASRRLIRADEGGNWTTLEVAFTLTTTEKAPDALEDPTAYVLVSSARSNTRIPVPLEANGSGFSGLAKLSRTTLSGAVEVTGHVVAGVETLRAVGTSDPWSIIVDPGEAPPRPGAPPFQTLSISFSSEEAPPHVRVAANSYAAMDLSGPKPVLYLNKDVVGLEAIIYSERPRLEKRRMRDLLGAQIAQYALSALFREALAQTEFDEDSVTLPGDQLLAQVVKEIAGAVSSVEDAQEMMTRLNGSPAERALLWIEVDNAMSRLTNLGEVVAGSLQEVHYG